MPDPPPVPGCNGKGAAAQGLRELTVVCLLLWVFFASVIEWSEYSIDIRIRPPLGVAQSRRLRAYPHPDPDNADRGKQSHERDSPRAVRNHFLKEFMLSKPLKSVTYVPEQL